MKVFNTLKDFKNPEVSFSLYKANRQFNVFFNSLEIYLFFSLVLLSEEVERGGVGL